MKSGIKIFFFGLLVLVFAWPLHPQRAGRFDRLRPANHDHEHATTEVQAQWAKRYYVNPDGPAGYDERTLTVQQTSDGGYVFAGYTGSIDYGFKYAYVLILKVGSQGAVEWQTYLKGNYHMYGGTDVPRTIEQTPDGGFVVGGFGGSKEAWVVKLNAAGVVEWKKGYGGHLGAATRCVQRTQDGGFIVAGRTSGSGHDVWVMKLLANGEVEWQKSYGGGLSEEARAVAQTADGGYIVAGTTDASGNTVPDALVLKLNSAGGVVWQKRYGESGAESASWVEPLPDGSCILGGMYDPQDALVVKLAPDGNIIWCRVIRPLSYGGARTVRATPDGGCIMAGPEALLRLNAYGDVAWQRVYEDFWAFAAQPTADGGFIFAGEYNNDHAAFKTDAWGSIEGCPLLREPGLTVISPALPMNITSLVPATLSGSPEDLTSLVPSAVAVDTEIICSPLFELSISAGAGGTTSPAPGNYVHVGGSSVKVKALPDASHVFTSWTGDVPEAERGGNPVSVEMDSNKSVRAHFGLKRTLQLSAGTGGTTDPAPGVYYYALGTAAILKALPDSDHVFSQWTGDVMDARKADNPLSVLMDIDRTLQANFLTRVFAPLDLRSETRANRSLFQTEYINVLAWTPNPKNSGIIKYRIYELQGGNLVLLGEAAVGTETYWHRKVEKGRTYTYVVKAVGDNDREGDPATVTITVS